MSEPYTDILEDEDEEAGIHRCTLSTAVCCWAWMQRRGDRVTVAEAAITFNTTPALIRQAVEDHPWAFLMGNPFDPQQQFIGHDGE